MITAIGAASVALAGQRVPLNPNEAAIREFGRIEWHANTATLIAGGGWPLRMAALALSSCLGISVSSEEPTYTPRSPQSSKSLLAFLGKDIRVIWLRYSEIWCVR
jgi:hypothetical protein